MNGIQKTYINQEAEAELALQGIACNHSLVALASQRAWSCSSLRGDMAMKEASL